MSKVLKVSKEGRDDLEIEIQDGYKKDLPYLIKQGSDGLHFKTQKAIESWGKRRFPGSKVSVS